MSCARLDQPWLEHGHWQSSFLQKADFLQTHVDHVLFYVLEPLIASGVTCIKYPNTETSLIINRHDVVTVVANEIYWETQNGCSARCSLPTTQVSAQCNLLQQAIYCILNFSPKIYYFPQDFSLVSVLIPNPNDQKMATRILFPKSKKSCQTSIRTSHHHWINLSWFYPSLRKFCTRHAFWIF